MSSFNRNIEYSESLQYATSDNPSEVHRAMIMDNGPPSSTVMWRNLACCNNSEYSILLVNKSHNFSHNHLELANRIPWTLIVKTFLWGWTKKYGWKLFYTCDGPCDGPNESLPNGTGRWFLNFGWGPIANPTITFRVDCSTSLFTLLRPRSGHRSETWAAWTKMKRRMTNVSLSQCSPQQILSSFERCQWVLCNRRPRELIAEQHFFFHPSGKYPTQCLQVSPWGNSVSLIWASRFQWL